TRSATGGALAKPETWTFTTPPPHVERKYPEGGPQRRDPVVFVELDQRIDPAAVLATTSLQTGTRRLPLRLASQAEIDADPVVAGLAKSAREGRWLAFRTAELLPTGATATVSIGPGTPSAEGPLRTAAVQTFSFTTYGAFVVIGHRCGFGEGD